MDFTPPAHLERTRNEIRAWLRDHPPDLEKWQRLRDDADQKSRVEYLKQWQRKLHEARWVAVHWPAAYGGRDATLLDHLAVQQELVRSQAPPLINGPSLSIFGPTLLQFGTPQQRERYLPRLLSAEEVWCLGFSEPNAGSDLASLRTRAERAGDGWLVNGQKVWTTYANQADYGLFLVRTDAGVAPHRGISCLIVSLASPGLTVRPLREMTGDNDFNEVFLDNVPVPLANLVGDVNQGWQVILTALGHERGTLLLVDGVKRQIDLERLRRLVLRRGKAGEPCTRQSLAQLEIETQIMRLQCLRVMSDLAQGRTESEVSLLKLFGSELAQRMDNFALDVQGAYAQLWRGAPRVIEEGEWQRAWLMARAFTIASGTSEIQRNIIAQRLLGLPRG